MKFNATGIEGAFVIELEKMQDDRGYFARTFCQNEFDSHGLSTSWAQANTAFSNKKGVLRGMHYQSPPFAEAKLVRCIRGAAFDVIIDLRPKSKSFSKWFGVELTPDNGKMLYVPEGFAHGYQTLKDDTELFYLVSQFYTPQAEQGVRWNDARFNISWPIVHDIQLSPKDQSWPDYEGTAPL